MRKIVVFTILAASVAVIAFAAPNNDVVVPAKISKMEIAGSIFDRDNMIETDHENGNTTLDVTTLLSSDKKFASGMYKSGKTYFEATDPYGVDEFMYFLEGSVKLTSSDGSSTLR